MNKAEQALTSDECELFSEALAKRSIAELEKVIKRIRRMRWNAQAGVREEGRAAKRAAQQKRQATQLLMQKVYKQWSNSDDTDHKRHLRAFRRTLSRYRPTSVCCVAGCSCEVMELRIEGVFFNSCWCYEHADNYLKCGDPIGK